MQNIQNQQNFCTFSQNQQQQPSILSTHRALRTMEGYADWCKTTGVYGGNTQYKIGSSSLSCPSGSTKGGSGTSYYCTSSSGTQTEWCAANGNKTKCECTVYSATTCCQKQW